MKRFFGITILTICIGVNAGETPRPAASDKLVRMLQQSTLTLLKEGNIRFVDDKGFHPHIELKRRAELARNGQEPIATVLACADSRAPVELVFDRGIGDLFVVRVAGNVAGLSELATMEYGVAHLGTPVLVVLGHSQCGAVTAAAKNADLHGHLPSLVSLLKPAVEKARTNGPEEDLIPRAVELNVWQQMQNIVSRSALLRDHVAAGTVIIVGAVYDLASGKVEWLGPHPEMDRLIAEANAQNAKPEPPAEPVAATTVAIPTAPAPAPTSTKSEPARTPPTHAAAAIQKSMLGSPMLLPPSRTEASHSAH